jgi:hypothetical protein
MRVEHKLEDFNAAIANIKMVAHYGVQGVVISTHGGLQKLERRDRFVIITTMRLFRDFLASLIFVKKYTAANELKTKQVKRILEAEWKVVDGAIQKLVNADLPNFLFKGDDLFQSVKSDFAVLKSWQGLMSNQDGYLLRKTGNSIDSDWKKKHQAMPKDWNNLSGMVKPTSSSQNIITVHGINIPYFDEAQAITLLQWKQFNPKMKELALKRFELNLDTVRQHVDLDKKIEELDDHILKSITLYDLKVPWDHSSLRFGLLTDGEIRMIKLEDVEIASEEQYSYLKSRLSLLEKHYPVIVDETSITPDNIMQQTLGTWRKLSSQKIREVCDSVQPAALCLFLEIEQIKTLDFALLSNKFKYAVLTFFYNLPYHERTVQMSAIPNPQLAALLEVMEEKHFHLLSEDHIRNLDFSKLDAKQIIAIFEGRGSQDEKQKRFANISSGQIDIVVSKLNNYFLQLLSDDHLAVLDFSKLDKDKIAMIFNLGNKKEEKRRVALLNPGQIKNFVDVVDDWHLGLVSDQQLQQIDFSTISKEKIRLILSESSSEKGRRLAFLLPEQVNEIMCKIDDWSWSKLVTDDQLKGLDTSRLSRNMIENLFPTTKIKGYTSFHHSYRNFNGKVVIDENSTTPQIVAISQQRLEEHRRRFALFSGKQVKTMQFLLNEDLKKMITESQKQEMNLLP